jgi:hypothetical protein
MRPRCGVPQKHQANFAFMPVTTLQTQDSSKLFRINTYKAPSQLLILNHLGRQLNPLDATLTKNRGEGGQVWSAPGHPVCSHQLKVQPTTFSSIPFIFNILRTLLHNAEFPTPLSSIASALFPMQRWGWGAPYANPFACHINPTRSERSTYPVPFFDGPSDSGHYNANRGSRRLRVFPFNCRLSTSAPPSSGIIMKAAP